MNDNHFDAIILGTGLTESILSAALSKAGCRVAHIDSNPYYGGDEACLSLDELIKWAQDRSSTSTSSSYLSRQRDRFSSISYTPATLPQSRQYSLSLSPSIVPSTGPLITSLIASGVARYGGFRLLDRVTIYDDAGAVKIVPGSKEDIFKNKDISLVNKRRLMRFLMFASGEFESMRELENNERMPFLDFLITVFSLDEEIAVKITFSLAYCYTANEPTLPALLRIRRYLRSAGRYGASSFLIGHYGGSGEIAQGFCRASAVHGGVYILDRHIESIDQLHHDPPPSQDPSNSSNNSVKLEGISQRLYSDVLISSPDYAPSLSGSTGAHSPTPLRQSLARCIAIIDRPAVSSGSSVDGASDTALIDTWTVVFPPKSVPGGSTVTSANALLTGEGAMSAPKGKCIIYLSMPLDGSEINSPALLLKPYLDIVIRLTLDSPMSELLNAEPLFVMYYTQHLNPQETDSPKEVTSSSHVLVSAAPSPLLSESVDDAAKNAETLFWKTIKLVVDNFPEAAGRLIGGERANIDSFWPPLENEADTDVDEEW